jgi:hypothetical protein
MKKEGVLKFYAFDIYICLLSKCPAIPPFTEDLARSTTKSAIEEELPLVLLLLLLVFEFLLSFGRLVKVF